VTLPHSLLGGVLRVKALEYASGLYPGATINEADLAYCAPFLAELPAALEHHGLQMVNGICERIDNKAQEAA
jgi:hypothetical protein